MISIIISEEVAVAGCKWKGISSTMPLATKSVRASASGTKRNANENVKLVWFYV